MELSTSDSVADMVRQATGDEGCASRVASSAQKRILINQLIAHRLKYDLSQDEVAERLNRSQSKVSKFENADDADLRLGDIVDYAKATGLLLTITMSAEKRKSAVAQIKYHAFQIKELLEQIVTIAGDDADMVDGAKHFLQLEVPVNLLKMVVDVAAKLPARDNPEDEADILIEDKSASLDELQLA